MTAVEQLMIALYEGGYLRGNGNEMDDILEKYKKVFKQQLEKTFDDAVESEILGKKITAGEYYNEIYVSGVFIEENAKDELYDKPFVVCEDCGMEECKCYQTEISDEEYYKDVFYQKQVMNPYPTGDQSYTAYEKGFMDFAKWYREQLKLRQ